ncbi:MAG: hypothetical protein NVSMB56_18550 [Pyrinomonadaceae bacterium]
MFLFLESIGTSELLFIAVAALVLFGPRKLPELARTIGRSLNDFRRASDDFKRTWQREVETERAEWKQHLSDVTTDVNPDATANGADEAKTLTALDGTTTIESVNQNSIAPPEVKTFETSNGIIVRPPSGEQFARGSFNENGAPLSDAVEATNGNASTYSPSNGSATPNAQTNATYPRKRDWL